RHHQKHKEKKRLSGEEQNNTDVSSEVTEGETHRQNRVSDDEYVPETLPIIISVSQEHKAQLENNGFLSRIKKDIFVRYGYRIPDIAINYSPIVPNDKIIVLINEISAGEYNILFEGFRLLSVNDELDYLGMELTRFSDIHGVVSSWVSAKDINEVEQLGLQVRDDISEIIDCIGTLLLHHINEFFGRAA
ncbi:FHIPEP family type III secretion protein, partial [Enterobacter hormaechei]|uniref:FHIPEP family type III secretion protein n=1 Tax=Enterobacter hormaechei TaxID=158836 RepID=UPI001E5C269F